MTGSSTNQTLKALGTACGMKVGFSTTAAGIQYASPALLAFYKANFNLLTPQNELKWAATQPTQGNFQFEQADFLLNFAQQNGMALRGHNLCWNTSNPAWLAQALTPSNAESMLVGYINTVAGRYAGKLDSWDVVNEPISVWNNQPGGLSAGPWLSTLGPQYIDTAFYAVAEADPEALRVLNLHEVEEASDVTSKAASLVLLEQLLNRGVPIQAVGLESHIDCGSAIDLSLLNSFISTIRSMGLQVLLTELDVNDSKVNGTLAFRDQIVADYYESYLNIALPAAGAERIVFWSPTDISWMDWMCEARVPEYERADGLCDHRPGLIDTTNQLKPAYSAVAASIQNYAAIHRAIAGQEMEVPASSIALGSLGSEAVNRPYELS